MYLKKSLRLRGSGIGIAYSLLLGVLRFTLYEFKNFHIITLFEPFNFYLSTFHFIYGAKALFSCCFLSVS